MAYGVYSKPKQRVYVTASSGSGMMEAAIRNGVSERVLCMVNGAFGRRWSQVAQGCGKQVVVFDTEWNMAIKPGDVEDALRHALAGGPVDAITIEHNETSTGVLNPVASLASVVHDISPDTLVMVDMVSSFVGTRTPFDEWQLDLALTSSQKALALPPGLAFCAVSDRLLARAEGIPGRGWYFDFLNLEKSLLKNTTPATPAISLMRALEKQMQVLFDEGLENRYERHELLGERIRDWAVDRGFELGAEAGYRSPTVTSIVNTHGLDISDVNRYLATMDMTISDGYGPYKGQFFRIAHMGQVTEADVDRLLQALDEYLTDKGLLA